MVRNDTQTLGVNAEHRALQFLRHHGLRLLRRNFRCRHGEIDLVMREKRCLVIVEVRYRSGKSLVNACHTVDRRKQQKLIRTAALLLAWNPAYARMPLRFDVVGIDVDRQQQTRIEWIRDAFRPEETAW